MNFIRTKDLLVGAITAAGLSVAAGGAHAAFITYTSAASFSTAAGAQTFTTEDFSTSTPGFLATNTAHGFNGFTATHNDGTSNMAFYVAPTGFSGAQHAPFTTSQHLGWAEDATLPGVGSYNGSGSPGPDITITFDQAITAVSFNFLDSDRTDEYRLLVNGIAVSGFLSTGSSYDNDFFFGIMATDGMTITSLTFDSLGTTGGFVEEFGIDNVSFATPPAAVSEPGTLAMFGLSLAGLGALSRRRKKQMAG